MDNTPANLRKAAVLLRSLDDETAATILARLSTAEAAVLREAVRSLGQVDAEEQADVAAEFRRVQPLATEAAVDGVQLDFTSIDKEPALAPPVSAPQSANAKRFEFLERAPIGALAPYLAREHAQTIAVVLSHLRPQRAAAVLGSLSGKQQAEVVDRLAILGDTDPESVTVVEHELAAWLDKRARGAPNASGRSGAAASILAAADAITRNGILANVRTYKTDLAARLAAAPGPPIASAAIEQTHRTINPRPIRAIWRAPAPQSQVSPPVIAPRPGRTERPKPTIAVAVPSPSLRIDFDQLTELNDNVLSEVIRDIDAGVLVLALAGSREKLIDKICKLKPKRSAREFRRQLRGLGPTRLSDVEAAQQAVALAASQRLADRRMPAVTSATT